jgi:hypothetical protein
VVRKYTHAGKIQFARQFPPHFRRNIPQAVPGGIVCGHDAKKNCLLTAPILTDLVANPHHVRSNTLLDAGDGSFDFCLLRDG